MPNFYNFTYNIKFLILVAFISITRYCWLFLEEFLEGIKLIIYLISELVKENNMKSDNTNKEVAYRLKSARTKTGLNISEVAQQTGLSVGNLSELENGKYLPSTKSLILLSDIYKVSIDWIVKGKLSDELPPNNEQIIVPDKRLREFLRLLVKLWINGDRDIKGWIIVQLGKAFPEINEEIKKRDTKTAGADTV